MEDRYNEEDSGWRKKIDDEIDFIRNLQAFITGQTITFEEYLRWECAEIFGEINAYFTGQNLKRQPTQIDLQQNYIIHEADKLFHRKHYYKVERRWQKSLKKYLHQIRLRLRKFFPGR